MKRITHFKGKLSAKGLFLTLMLVSFLTTTKLSAQLFCNNEFVYWTENFGTGAYSSDPNIINLSFEANDNVPLNNNGTYRSASLTDQNSAWHKSLDHTPGDVNGKTVVINAKAGDFYTKELPRAGGYPAGFYSLSLYVMNVDIPGYCGPTPLLPVISIIAEYQDANGNWVALQNSPVTTYPIPETTVPTWLQIGGVFTLPTTGNFLVTSIRFTLSDLTLGGCGNDFAIDDLQFSTCPDGAPIAPVDFINVVAQKKGSGVNIFWSTGSEFNNQYFEVERSNDGGNTWVLVAKVPGSLNSTTTKKYVAYDAKPTAGANYYRIKQVDVDAASKFSSTIVYKLTIDRTDVSVLANPFYANITVDFLSDRSQIVNSRLFDNTGKQVIAEKINIAKGSSRKAIATANLSRGIYILQVTDENGQLLYNDKLIKQ